MWSFVDHLGNYKLLWDLDVFEPPQETHEQSVRDVADIYFGSSYGRAWYEENKSSINSATVQILDDELEDLGSDEFLDQFRRIQDRIKAEEMD